MPGGLPSLCRAATKPHKEGMCCPRFLRRRCLNPGSEPFTYLPMGEGGPSEPVCINTPFPGNLGTHPAGLPQRVLLAPVADGG